MTDLEVVALLTPRQVVALTLYGEGRGEPIEGRIAIANVIRNRVKAQRAAYGFDYRAVCLKAWQFSCWLPQGGRDNYETVVRIARQWIAKEPPLGARMVNECAWIADGLLADAFLDTVRSATHYYNPDGMVPRGAEPKWAVGLMPVALVGSHRFYAGVK